MSTHPGASFVWSLRSTALSATRIWSKKHCVIRTSPKLIQGIFAYKDVANVVSTASYTMLIVTSCAIRTQLRNSWWFHCTLFCVQLFASRTLSHCKHDVGALAWLNVETVKGAPTPPFWQTCKVLQPWSLFLETTVPCRTRDCFLCPNQSCSSSDWYITHAIVDFHSLVLGVLKNSKVPGVYILFVLGL